MWGNKKIHWIGMLGFIALSSLGIAAAPSFPESAKTPKAFIPKGWHVLAKAEGDLNNDKVPDMVLILANDQEDKSTLDNQVPRLFLVLFKTEDGYTLAASSDKVVFCKTCGGMMGDPFQGIKIDRGTVVLDYYGGSRDRWSMTHRFRYQNSDFYLIGQTTTTDDILNLPVSKSVDTNLLTGDQIKTTTDASGKTSVQKARVPRRALVSISSPEIADALAN